MRKERITFLAASLIVMTNTLPASARVIESPRVVEVSRAVARWWVPLGSNTLRMYEVDIHMELDLSTGKAEGIAELVRDICEKERVDARTTLFYCDHPSRKEISTRKVELTVADDLSNANAVIKIGKRRHVVDWSNPGAGTGLWNDRRTCSEGAGVAAGRFENMDLAQGSLFERSFDAPASQWDHYWLEKGNGISACPHDPGLRRVL